MPMTIAKRVLRLLTPETENMRMQMREARCKAEASAEDLTRTIRTNREVIEQAIKKACEPKPS